MRPWKGPIPKRRPPVLTLEAFLPESSRKRLLNQVRPPVRGPDRECPGIWLVHLGPDSQWAQVPYASPIYTKRPAACAGLSRATVTNPSEYYTDSDRCTAGTSFANVVRKSSAPMPPYPRQVDRGRGRGPNTGRRDGSWSRRFWRRRLPISLEDLPIASQTRS